MWKICILPFFYVNAQDHPQFISFNALVIVIYTIVLYNYNMAIIYPLVPSQSYNHRQPHFDYFNFVQIGPENEYIIIHDKMYIVTALISTINDHLMLHKCQGIEFSALQMAFKIYFYRAVYSNVETS